MGWSLRVECDCGADRAVEAMEGGVTDWEIIKKKIMYLPPAVSNTSHNAYFLTSKNRQQEIKENDNFSDHTRCREEKQTLNLQWTEWSGF